MYVAHPSPVLGKLFADKPYQGVAPKLATFLFVGLDANYGAEIESKSIFSKVREYHDDGVTFWRKHAVHHPFLLPEYSGDGKFYHRSFARIGFRPQHADMVSFVELLHVPTVGRNNLVAADLLGSHLKMLNSAILDGQAEHILPAGVVRLMQATGAFPWLPKKSQIGSGPLGTIFRSGSKTVYSHLHLSVYGKFAEQKSQQATAIGALLYRDLPQEPQAENLWL